MPQDFQLSMFDENTASSLNDNGNNENKELSSTKISVPETPENLRVFVIDAYGLLYQVFHALPEMHGRQGESVNAIFGFMRDLFFLLEHLNPDFLFCAFDLHHPTFRHDVYDQYKIQREKMPEDLRPQIPLLKELLHCMKIPVLEEQGFEADDILATVATETEKSGGNCILVTSDKDCRQLLSDHVQIYSLRRGKYLDCQFLMDDWGITPSQVIDYQSLVGDASDNIPGISKIGPKIARELLQRFGSITEILKPENITLFFGAKNSTRKQNLLDGAETLRMSQELVTLRRDVPISIHWPSAHISQFNFLAALPFFQEYSFRTLSSKLSKLQEKYHKDEYSTPSSSSPSEESSLPRNTFSQKNSEPSFFFKSASTEEIPIFPHSFDAKLVTEDTKKQFLLPAFFENTKTPGFREKLETLRPDLENPKVIKIGFDLKKIWKILRSFDINPAGPIFDIMIAAYMLIPGEKQITLEELTLEFPEAVPEHFLPDLILSENQNQNTSTPLFLFNNSQESESQDSDASSSPPESSKKIRKTEKQKLPPHPSIFPDYQQKFLENLFPILIQKLAHEKLDTVCYLVEFPLIPVLAIMEYTGIYVNRACLKSLHTRFSEKAHHLREELLCLAYPETEFHSETLASQTLNLNSPVQLQKILFEKLGLPALRKTKTGISTDAQTLEELAAMNLNPFPEKLLEYRQVTKLMNTYVDALPSLIDEKTGRIHTTFNQAVTATGRLSSSDPNLQNIPVRTSEGREIRSAFIPHPKEWQFLSADYSQIELRVLAHYCKDENLCNAFIKNEDIHTMVAAEIFSTAVQDVTPAMRRVAKSVNFGVIYGQSAFGLSKQLNIPQDEAQHFIHTYFERYPSIQIFLEQVLDNALTSGHVSTILGRYRRITGIRPVRKGQLNLAERMAVNAVIQGSAADIIKLAMLTVHHRLKKENLKSRLLLQIHDELLLEVSPTETDTVKNLVQEEMTHIWNLDVPLKVHTILEKDWGEKD
ncbi:MAG: DNA polymerase I [Planctomycetia bacterium]|nr:DNA polymerase I [Planctomycetia bacterium]